MPNQSSESPSSDDDVVAELLGRRPQGQYSVVLRRPDGQPVILANAPFLYSGRPMPTRYWLVDPKLNKSIGQLESTGGVKQAEAAVDPDELQRAHDRYRLERDDLIPTDHDGPRPSGGVGGTRVGVKCLHTHYAYYLAGGDDPVGAWVHDQLAESGQAFDRSTPAPTTSHGASMLAIEIGSGAVKAIVESADGTQSRLRFETMLASELSADGLSPRGRQELTTAFASIRDEISEGVTARAVATGVLRDYESSEVHNLVTEYFDIDLEVLSGAREAEFGYRALNDPSSEQALVVSLDIGYASTELATRRSDGTIVSASLPIGAQVVVDTYIESDPPHAAELSAALSVIELHMDDVVRDHRELAKAIADGEIVGLGAVRFFAEVELGQNDGDSIDGYWLSYPDVEEVFRILATESKADRVANPGLRPEHVEVIVGAGCILVEFMRQFLVAGLRVSTAGVVDSVAAELRLGQVS